MMHPKLRPGLMRTALPGDEEVLSTADQSKAVIVNTTGAAVIDLCDGTRTIEDIAAFICAHIHGADVAEVRADVARIVDELSTSGLLVEG